MTPAEVWESWERAADAAERETEERYAVRVRLRELAAAEWADAVRRGEARARLESALRLGR